MLSTAFFTGSAGDTFFGLLGGDAPVHSVAVEDGLFVSTGQDQLIIAVEVFGDWNVDRAGEAVAAAGAEIGKGYLQVGLDFLAL